MKQKDSYEKAKIDVTAFSDTDIVTASDGGSMGTGSDNMTDGGWTPIEW